MPCFKSLLTVIILVATASANVVTITAMNDSTFHPDSVFAEAGDILEFLFEGSNHSVVAGDYRLPCSPLPLGSGFFSGSVDFDGELDEHVFRVNVRVNETTVFYSSVGDECASGMVGIINPCEEMNLEDYRHRASGLAGAVTPSTVPFGGKWVHQSKVKRQWLGNRPVFEEPKVDSIVDFSAKNRTVRSKAAGMLKTSVLTVAGALGAALMV